MQLKETPKLQEPRGGVARPGAELLSSSFQLFLKKEKISRNGFPTPK